MDINIHIAKHSDVDSLVLLAKEWAKEIDKSFTDETLKEEIESKLDNCSVIIACNNTEPCGFAVCYVVDNLWSDGKVACEYVVYVSPKNRFNGVSDQLLATYRAWAKVNECKYMMISPTEACIHHPKQVAEHLIHKGYETYGYMMRREV